MMATRLLLLLQRGEGLLRTVEIFRLQIFTDLRKRLRKRPSPLGWMTPTAALRLPDCSALASWLKACRISDSWMSGTH